VEWAGGEAVRKGRQRVHLSFREVLEKKSELGDRRRVKVQTQ
jgi:hypothetical protein